LVTVSSVLQAHRPEAVALQLVDVVESASVEPANLHRGRHRWWRSRASGALRLSTLVSTLNSASNANLLPSSTSGPDGGRDVAHDAPALRRSLPHDPPTRRWALGPGPAAYFIGTAACPPASRSPPMATTRASTPALVRSSPSGRTASVLDRSAPSSDPAVGEGPAVRERGLNDGSGYERDHGLRPATPLGQLADSPLLEHAATRVGHEVPPGELPDETRNRRALGERWPRPSRAVTHSGRRRGLRCREACRPGRRPARRGSRTVAWRKTGTSVDPAVC